MRYKLICCEVFLREACYCIAGSPHTVDPVFTPKEAHNKPACLKEQLQEMIEEAEKAGIYDAVLLGFGLCGNGIVGLKSTSVPLVIPRAHDCCTILLGSREKFLRYFGDKLSAEWSSAGYMERGGSFTRLTDTNHIPGLDMEYEELLKKYGEENARYIWETLHPKKDLSELIYIDIPETSNPAYIELLKNEADKTDKKLRVLPGEIGMIQSLIWGNWDEREFLIVPPGHAVKGVYDQEEVITLHKPL
ncbi:MAG: DUF1638 domain-containing protein [Caldicoprobacterales bacterium]|jgi:hypothetical protein|nr:DUF1638 domain-containing protein [Clostridiales bacterium]